MSYFKGDTHFTSHADVPTSDSNHYDPMDVESDYDDTASFDSWLLTHYDVLQELYDVFRTHGQALFGGCFMQFSTFGHFCRFVHDMSIP